MFEFVWRLSLLAADEAPKQQPNPLSSMLPLFLMIAVLWYFVLLRPQKREQQRREQLLSSLKKNDRVVTIGGIIGTIANVSSDGKDVMLKVDENTRIRVLRSSIQGPYGEEAEGAAKK